MKTPGKPIAALVLPPRTAEHMFRADDLRRLEEAAKVVGPADKHDAEAVKDALADATVAITGWGSPRFDAELLAWAPKLKLVAHSAGSVKSVVSDALYDRGIQVCTSAGVNAVPVAQYTVAMMVAALKQIPWIGLAYARNDQTDLNRRLPLVRELQDLHIGIIGASRTGREVIKLLQAFPRLVIRVYDPYLTREEAKALGVQLCPLEDVFHCDVVSLHAPANPQTHHMLNSRTLALLPPHAVLINTARGGLIDEAALIAEVRRRPLYVVLDVSEPEPPGPASALRTEPNIFLTPHLSGAMAQARFDMGAMAIDQTLCFLRGKPLRDEVTSQMLPTQA